MNQIMTKPSAILCQVSSVLSYPFMPSPWAHCPTISHPSPSLPPLLLHPRPLWDQFCFCSYHESLPGNSGLKNLPWFEFLPLIHSTNIYR